MHLRDLRDLASYAPSLVLEASRGRASPSTLAIRGLAPNTINKQLQSVSVFLDGVVLAGTLCKKTLGASAGGLVHVIWMECGPEAARAFLSQVQFTVNQWLLQHGFSIGEEGAKGMNTWGGSGGGVLQ